MTEPTDIKQFKKRREREKYNALVLAAYDALEHADKRAMLDQKAEVQIKARERL